MNGNQWHDEWVSEFYPEKAEELTRLAIEALYRRYDWFERGGDGTLD